MGSWNGEVAAETHCFKLLALSVGVSRLLPVLITSWVWWIAVGKVKKGSKCWPKHTTFLFFIQLSLPPLRLLLLLPSLEACPSTSGEAALLRELSQPSLPLCPCLAASLCLPPALYLCFAVADVRRGDAASRLWKELTEAGFHLDLPSDPSGRSWQHPAFLFFFILLLSELNTRPCETFQHLLKKASAGPSLSGGALPPPCVSVEEWDPAALGMTEILVSDVNLNSVCERLEQHCCVDPNQHYQPSPPQTPVLKRHTNTGAKLWGRVRSKLLRQKVWLIHRHTHKTHTSFCSPGSICLSFSFHGVSDSSLYLTAQSVVKTKHDLLSVTNKSTYLIWVTLNLFDLQQVLRFLQIWLWGEFLRHTGVWWRNNYTCYCFRRSADTQTAPYFPGYWIIQKYNEESLRHQE